MNTANPTQPDPVTALTRECAEKIYALNRGWSCAYKDFESIIAATLSPVVEERDQLRAEVEALKQSHSAIYLSLATQEADHTKWPDQIKQLRATLDVAEGALKWWQELKRESRGVAGYHQNGDVAEWDDLNDLTAEALARIAVLKDNSDKQ